MLELETLRLSYSSHSTFESCARKLEFRKFYPHATNIEENLPGEVGHALHTGYQDWLVNRERESAIQAMMLRYPIDLCSDPNDHRSLEACYATLNTMMDSGIFMEYEVASIHCPDGVIRKAIEVPFQIDIKNFSVHNDRQVNVIYVGFIDVILFDTILQEYIAPDIKTTRLNETDYSVLYNFDTQCLPYSMVLERILGQPLKRLNVNYLVAYVDLVKPRALRYSFEKSEEDIRDWARTFYSDLLEIKKFYSLGWFPRRHKGCYSFRKKCEFFDICHTRNPEAIKKWFLMGDEPFVEKEFKPWFKMELELAA